jgi:hypothetical protein
MGGLHYSIGRMIMSGTAEPKFSIFLFFIFLPICGKYDLGLARGKIYSSFEPEAFRMKDCWHMRLPQVRSMPYLSIQ